MIKISRFIKNKGSKSYRRLSSNSFDSLTFRDAVGQDMAWARTNEKNGRSKIVKKDYSNFGRDFTFIQESKKTGGRILTKIQDRPWETAKKGGKKHGV